MGVLEGLHSPDEVVYRVLLVSSDAGFLAQAQARLAATRVQSTPASSLAAARAALADRYDAVLVALRLDDGDGRDLLLELSLDPSFAGVPVIVLADALCASVQAECTALGASQCLATRDVGVIATTVGAVIAEWRQRRADQQRDPLTGLQNREGLVRTFDLMQGGATRKGRRLSLAVLDIDRFKELNDRYGHAAGDAALVGVAAALRSVIRVSDAAARLGGDEFVVLAMDADARGAADAIRRAQQQLQREPLHYGERVLMGLTLSGGAVDVGPADGIESALQRADLLMYAAKSAGRDRIFHGADGDTPRTKRVLIVEDDADLAETLSVMLSAVGAEPTTASSIASAQQIATAGGFDMALVDRDAARRRRARLRARPARPCAGGGIGPSCCSPPSRGTRRSRRPSARGSTTTSRSPSTAAS